MPAGPMDPGPWAPAPRLPLWDPHHGACHARPAEIFEPPEISQRDLCNCGYVRGQCAHFPEDSPADAVRFSITGDDAGVVRLVYILEKDHSPAEYGRLEFSADEQRFLGHPKNELLAAQALAFVASYRR